MMDMLELLEQANEPIKVEKPQLYKGLKVLGLVADDTACGHYRVVHPLTYLNMYGAECEWTQYCSLEQALKADLIIAQRQYDMSIAKGILLECFKADRSVIYEVDDDLFSVEHSSPAYTVYHGGSKATEGVSLIMRACHGVTVSTVELAAECYGRNNNIEVLPNSIDFEIRDWKTRPKDKDNSKIVVGWSGGATHRADLELIKQPILHILNRYPHVQFGMYTSEEMMRSVVEDWGVEPERVKFIPPRKFDNYPSGLPYFDIGLAPVHNNRFNAAKCLDGETRVSTARGIIKIKDVKVGDLISDGNLWRRVEATEKQERKMGLRITTNSGYTLDVTKEHRLFRSRKGWTVAEDLKVGQFLDTSEFGVASLPCIKYEFSDIGHTVWITEEMATLLGFFLHVGKVLPDGSPVIPLTQTRESLLGEYLTRLLNQLGVGCEKTKYKQHHMYKIVSKGFTYLLNHIGAIKDGEVNRKVPECIWNSSREIIGCFMSIPVEYSKITPRGGVQILHDDIGWLEDIHILLLALQTTSRLYREKRGFMFRGNFYSILMNCPQATQMFKNVPYCSNRYVSNRMKIAKTAGRMVPWWSDVIAKIEDVELDPYDIQVEGHAFIANGLVSHNSNLKVIEYGAWGIPAFASKVAPYATTIVNGQNGFLDFPVDKLCMLIEDEKERKRIGNNMYNLVRDRFDMDKNCHLWPIAWTNIIERYRQEKSSPHPGKRWGSTGRNEMCPCGSNRKYKQCCAPAFG